MIEPRFPAGLRVPLSAVWMAGHLVAQEADISIAEPSDTPSAAPEAPFPSERPGEPPPETVGLPTPATVWFNQTLAVLREKGLAGDETALRRAWIEGLLRADDPDARVFAPGEAPAVGDTPPAGPPFCETENLPRRLVRIEVKTLASGAGLAIGAALDQAFRQGAAGIALDLRRAGGDSLADIGHIAARYAIGNETVLNVQDLENRVIERVMAWGGTRARGRGRPPMLVLVGPETRGAAEVLAAAMDRQPGVMTLGRLTANDPPIRETVMLPDGWSARVATRRIVFPDGGMLDAKHRFEPRRKLPDDLRPEPKEPENNGGLPDRRKTIPQEEEDRRLRDRVRDDPELRRTVDLLLALAALQPEN